MMDFLHDFSIDYEFDNARRAYRVKIPGLFAELEGISGRFPVLDISSTGIALFIEGMEKGLERGQSVVVALYLKERLLMQGLEALIVRFMDNGMALEFTGLTLRQEIRLDKIVLESQKKRIELKKKMSQQEDEPKET
ncbi:MAG: PilZ domain-containing protein [Desulfonatronovibrionaceae bacterium]